jgi:hypothetical protein
MPAQFCWPLFHAATNKKRLKGSTLEICCKKTDERPQLSVRNENPFDEGIAFVIGINERFLKRMLPA